MDRTDTSGTAVRLLQSLHAPAGATIWPMTVDGKLKLVIKVDKRYRNRLEAPTCFEGYEVIMEELGEITAYGHPL
jgi:hypothetical protein